MQPLVIGVVGLGTMGLGIAQVFAQAGHAVIGFDADPAMRATAADRLARSLSPRVAAGKLLAAEAALTRARLTVTQDLATFAGAALTIEAVVERLDVKQALLRSMEAVVAPDAVLATNTSSLSVASVAQGLSRPARLLGLHFFNPAPAMRLVEIAGHAGTDPASLTLARTLTEGAGKTLIASPDRPGFIVNRCARPFYGEALALLSEGRHATEIDAAMVGAGYRMGPFALIDLVGADINLAATEGLSAAMGGHPRYHVFPALREAVAARRLGAKSGAGFVHGRPPALPPPDAAAIVLRIEATLANEAATLLAEGAAQGQIDTAMRLGLNWPQGPLAAAQAHGLATIRATLRALEAAAPPHLAGRYTPSPALEALT